jgi:aspartyl-tRNA synthetase
MERLRTHNCGELTRDHLGRTVRLAGWLHNRRDHGGVLFVDLRDHYGLTQIVVYQDSGIQEAVGHLHKETVIQFEGTVVARSPENVNTKLATGEVEIRAARFEVLGPCESLPFSVFPEEDAPEETRLKYRFLDLRHGRLHNNIVLRSRVIASMRRRMTDEGFLEIQTPILTASSPEGARDFLVPSRLHPGSFYALPQAPQQYKQLLMVSGFDRYFQIAPCFRDEDARANRSPGEFYQLDIEMAFPTQDEIFEVVERVISGVFGEFSDWDVTPTPFARIPYAEAMVAYGSDKPDLRNPIRMVDVSSLFAAATFAPFRSIVEKKGVVRAIPVKGIEVQPRSFFDRMVAHAQALGSQGLAYLAWSRGGDGASAAPAVKGPLTKHLSEAQLADLAGRCGVGPGDVVFFVANTQSEAERISGELRTRLGEDLSLLAGRCYRFCWVVDYPMYQLADDHKTVEFSHNPFSMPQGGLQALESRDPLEILAWQYDLVCNGVELSSGAIRNHRPDIMYRAFEIGGYTRDEVDRDFGAMINAFRLGAPPHGGIAPGVDRMIMLLADEPNIREVTAFPMSQKAQDLMMNAPRPVTDKQLNELHIRVALPLKKQ